MRMDEFRFLVKFPPHIRVESKVLGEVTYFYLKNNFVMASLKVWNGDIEHVGQLVETWVQIKGVPPKWCDWTTIKEIASTIGKLAEVDWQTLFSSFFTVIRVKINCKDPRKIPESRVMKMADKLYMISFEVEEFDKLKEKMDELDGGIDPSHKGEDEGGRPEEGDDDKPEDELPPAGEENDKGISSTHEGTSNSNEGRTKSVRKALLICEENSLDVMAMGVDPIPSCVSLLRAMELTDSDEEPDLLDSGKGEGDTDSTTLLKEWLCPELGLVGTTSEDSVEYN